LSITKGGDDLFMTTAVQKHELDFIWSHAITGYQWEDCRPCDPWGDPIDEWEEERKKGLENLFQIPDGPYLTKAYPQTRDMPYEPFENEAMFAQFSDLNPNKESFCDWANENGRLIDVEDNFENYAFIFPEYFPLNKTDVQYHSQVCGMHILERDGRFFYRAKADPLSFWVREHDALSFTVMIWEWALNADPRLEKILEYDQETRRVYIYVFPKNKLKEIDLNRLREGTNYNSSFVKPPYKLERYLPAKFNAKEAGLSYVQEKINTKLAYWPMRIFFKTGKDGEFRRVIEPTSLLSAMWYQFYQALAGEIRLRRCSLCGKWESMKEHRKTWTKHKNCANYARVKKSRLKNRENSEEI
jgi:hypothetical protein